MNNFKSGSGNLDFGGGDEDEEDDDTVDETAETHAEQTMDSSTTADPGPSHSSETRSDGEQRSDRGIASEETSAGSSDSYPYFVRRSNVGDERDTRLEIHVRDKVAEQEATYRSELADQLGTTEISKTDAREFALLAAFQHPERVAELMQDEGFGTLD